MQKTAADYTREALQLAGNDETGAVVRIVNWCESQSNVREAFGFGDVDRNDSVRLEELAREWVRKELRPVWLELPEPEAGSAKKPGGRGPAVQDGGVAEGPIGRRMKDIAMVIGYLVSYLSVPFAVVFGVFGWLALVYGAGLAVGLLIAWIDRRWRFLPAIPVVRENAPLVAGATAAIALLALLHSFIHPEFSWSNVLFLFSRT